MLNSRCLIHSYLILNICVFLALLKLENLIQCCQQRCKDSTMGKMALAECSRGAVGVASSLLSCFTLSSLSLNWKLNLHLLVILRPVVFAFEINPKSMVEFGFRG